MNEGPADPTQPSGSGSASTPPGSRFEDLTNFEVPVDAVATGHRTAILITAAVVLDGIEDPQNLGASARSAEAAGASVLVSRTHRGAPVTDAAIRASAGALLHLRHARDANIARANERLQAAGFSAVGLDGSAEGSIFDTRCPDGRVAIVLGSEGSGLSRLVRERCDLLVALPMRGRVDSLNAAASLAAALYAFVLPRGPGGDG